MKQCDFSFFLPFFFIYCISILYGLLVLLFVFPLIDSPDSPDRAFGLQSLREERRESPLGTTKF